MTFAQVAEFYNLSLTTIQNWKRCVHSQATRQIKPYKIPDDVLLNDVKERPDDYQYERARCLNYSKTGIYNAFKRLGINQKKTLEYLKACLIKRAAYQRKLDSFIHQGYSIVYMEESGFEHETIRYDGYAHSGKPCIEGYNWQGKKRTNVICTFYEKMLFALDYCEANMNSSIFYNCCKQTLIPSLKKMRDCHG